MSSSTKFKTDVDQLDDLVKDLLDEVNRPIKTNENTTNYQYSYQRHSNNDLSNSKLPTSSASTINNQKQYEFDSSAANAQRSKTTREERIRIKRGGGEIEIPVVTSSSSSMTTTTTTKPQVSSSAVDEQLIDSLLESVQNTLRKREQRNQSNWSSDVPIYNRRAYSSSATYTDSDQRMDSMRGRYPIKINRTDSPTSTISSRRPYSRQETRDGHISASTSAIPTHFRATSEPPPDGPIELRRMDLIRSPSRTFVEIPSPHEHYHYSRSTMPSRGIRVRGHDYSGYETDTGLMTSRGYGQRYYRAPPAPVYPYHHYQESQRSMLRPDGYDTDSGLISSGRLRMTRTLPPRMAVIPETVVVNNRMVSSSTNVNAAPTTTMRSNSFVNQTGRSENLTGYETDSGMNTRQYSHDYRQIPVHLQYGDNNRWAQNQSLSRGNSQQSYNQGYRQQQQQQQIRGTSIPVYSRQFDQQIRTTTTNQPPSTVETHKKSITVLPTIFPGSVGLSNPLSDTKQQQQQQQQIEIKRKVSDDHSSKRSNRPHGTVIDNIVLQTPIDPGATKQQVISTSTTTTTKTEFIPTTNVESHTTKSTSTVPLVNQSYSTNVQTRVGHSSLRSQEENSRRSSASSATESDVPRGGALQAHNVSQFWYKEKMSRDDAINLLKTRPPGAFLIRDSQGFPGSFGLAVKVETLPPGIQSKPGADPNSELVRHYLIERTPTGHVRLKGCSNEPDFPNLSALVYQHTLTPLALPIKLVLPTFDIAENYQPPTNQQQQPQDAKKMSVKDLLEKGAACNVVYLNNVDVDTLSGQMAVAKALRSTFDNAESLQPTIVNFKVSNTGITLTDTKKKLFSRRHIPKEYVTYCGVDYEADRFWTHQFDDLEMLPKAKCFGFVSKKVNGTKNSQNECHVFAEVDLGQPSTAIVNFVSKVMIGSVPV